MSETPTEPTVSTLPGRNGGTLTPWPKGVSGNPLGMGLPARRMAAALEARVDPDVIAQKLISYATDDDPKVRSAAIAAIREINDRIDGPVPKAHVHAHMAAPVERRKVREVDYDVPAEVVVEDGAQMEPDAGGLTGAPGYGTS